MKTQISHNSKPLTLKPPVPMPRPRNRKNSYEFDLYLEEFLQNSDSSEKPDPELVEEFPILLPRYGRYWDNGYEDVDKGGR